LNRTVQKKLVGVAYFTPPEGNIIIHLTYGQRSVVRIQELSTLSVLFSDGLHRDGVYVRRGVFPLCWYKTHSARIFPSIQVELAR
jgi:hypothetical protein